MERLNNWVYLLQNAFAREINKFALQKSEKLWNF